jgi:hypothetical protein
MFLDINRLKALECPALFVAQLNCCDLLSRDPAQQRLVGAAPHGMPEVEHESTIGSIHVSKYVPNHPQNAYSEHRNEFQAAPEPLTGGPPAKLAKCIFNLL